MKKIFVIAMLALLAFSCAKEPAMEGTNPGKTTINLRTSDFGTINVATRASLDPNGIADIVILQFVDNKCVLNTLLEGSDVTSTPSVDILPMTGNTQGNGLFVFCNFKSVNNDTDPFTAIAADAPLSALDAIVIGFDPATATGKTPMRGSFTGTINAGSDQTVNVTLGRMYSQIDFTLVNNFDGFTPTRIQLKNVPVNVAANGIVPVVGQNGNPTGFTAFPASATRTDLAPETFSTNKFHWDICESYAGNYNDVTPSAGAWSNLLKNPAATTKDGSLDGAGFYTIDAFVPYIEVEGVATITASGIPATVTYKIYLGSDANGDMNVAGNYVYNVTTTILGINTFDSRITVGQNDGTVLSPLSPANSYMIYAPDGGNTPAMKLGIPLSQAKWGQEAVAGITGETAVTDFSGATAEVVWQSWPSNSNLKDALGIDGDYIVLDLSANGIESGNNAVIALKKGGEILWSWHLWFTDYRPNTANFNVNGQVDKYINPNMKAMMDRNLGATVTGVSTPIAEKMSSDAAWASANAPKLYGLMYQWGRKDAFTPSSDGTATPTPIYDGDGNSISDITPTPVDALNMLAVSVKNPTNFYYNATTPYDWYTNTSGNQNNFLWVPNAATSGTNNNVPANNPGSPSKSIFDPCPPGWKVAGDASWNKATNPWAGFNGFDYAGNYSVTNYTYLSDGTTTVNSVPGVTPDNPEIFQYYSQGTKPGTTNGMYGSVGANATNGRMFNYNGTKAWYPASGSRYSTSGAFNYVGSTGYNWSGAVTGTYGFYLSFSSTNVSPANSNARASGFPVRCLQE